MSKSKSSSIESHISLCEAFVLLGTALFEEDWDEDCLRLDSPDLWHNLGAPYLYDPDKSDPWNWENTAKLEADGILSKANANTLKRYNDTLTKLRSGLGNGDITALDISSIGSPTIVEKSMWLDGTGIYEISILSSTISQKGSNKNNTWKIKIERNSFEKFIKTVVRSVAAKKNSSNVGAKKKYDDDNIIKLVERIYSQSNGDLNNQSNGYLDITKCCERCFAEMIPPDWSAKDVPGETKMKELIEEFKKTNNIN